MVVPYAGHLLTSKDLEPDPAKIKAVCKVPTPTDQEGIGKFLAVDTYLSKFIPNLSEVEAWLWRLLKSEVQLARQPSQKTPLINPKTCVCSHQG